jgi:hypothetical protein
MDWIVLAQDWDRWWALLNVVMTLLSLSIPVVCMIITYVEVRQHNLFLKINNFILQITYYK